MSTLDCIVLAVGAQLFSCCTAAAILHAIFIAQPVPAGKGLSADRDSLTAVGSRAALLCLLRDSHRWEMRLAVVVINLDGFAAFIDAYGHRAADQLIRQAADDIGSVCAARGGWLFQLRRGEFAVILADQHADGAIHIAALILAEIGRLRRVHVDGSPIDVHVTACAGIAMTGLHTVSELGLPLAQADTAMRSAKQAGCGQVGLAEQDRLRCAADGAAGIARLAEVS